MIPRIRARTGRGEDDKWYFEISVWSFDGEKQAGEPITIGPWESEQKAKDEMMKAVQMVSEHYEKEKTGEVSGKYLDMKNGGVLRPWKTN